MVKRYLYLSRSWFVDVDERNFVKFNTVDKNPNFIQGGSLSFNCEIICPRIYWGGTEKRTPYKSTLGFFLADTHYDLSYGSFRRAKITVRSDIVITIDCSFGIHYGDLSITSANYEYKVMSKKTGQSGGLKTHRTEFDRKIEQAMTFNPELECVYKDNSSLVLAHGLIPAIYAVFYKGRQLSGMTLAFMCGTWGILLKDDLSFDSFVVFKSYTPSSLEVDKFIYTVNPYITKLAMLS